MEGLIRIGALFLERNNNTWAQVRAGRPKKFFTGAELTRFVSKAAVKSRED